MLGAPEGSITTADAVSSSRGVSAGFALAKPGSSSRLFPRPPERGKCCRFDSDLTRQVCRCNNIYRRSSYKQQSLESQSSIQGLRLVCMLSGFPPGLKAFSMSLIHQICFQVVVSSSSHMSQSRGVKAAVLSCSPAMAGSHPSILTMPLRCWRFPKGQEKASAAPVSTASFPGSSSEVGG